MKICFYGHADRLYYYVPVAERICDDPERQFFFIVDSEKEAEYVKSRIPSAKVYTMFDYLEEKATREYTSVDMENLQKRYPEQSTWRMLYVDRFIVNYDKETVERMVLNHFSFFESIFEVEKPDFVLNEAVAIFASYVLLAVAQKNGCKFIGANMDRTDPFHQFYVFSDLYQLSDQMKSLYERNEFDADTVDKAKKYYESFIETDSKPAYMKNHVAPKFNLKCLAAPVSYVTRFISSHKKEHSNKYNYIEYRRPWRDRCYMSFEKYVRFSLSKKYYHEPDFSEKYYLFTLHFQPEASTLVCAQKYEKQLTAIDHIAKSLPFGTVLYVKEHYSCLGHRKLSFYKQLQSYPNVKLITPFANIHEMIRNSQAVIVLTSTTGFEAILHKKKVFVLGNVFYQFAKNAHKIDDVFDEWNALQDTSADQSDEEVIRFLCAYMSVMHSGNIRYGSEGFDLRENMDDICKSYLEIIDDEIVAKKL